MKVNRTCELGLKIYYSRHYVDVCRSHSMTKVTAGHCVVQINLGSLVGEQQYTRSSLTRCTCMQQKIRPSLSENVRRVSNVQRGLLSQLNISNGANLLTFGWYVIEYTAVLRIFIILDRTSWSVSLQCKEILGQI